MIIRINLLTIFYFSITLGFAQSTAQDRIISFEKIVQSDTVLNSIHFRNVGPTIMSGRVTDVEVNPNNTTGYGIPNFCSAYNIALGTSDIKHIEYQFTTQVMS